MARDFDDDAPRRIQAANERIPQLMSSASDEGSAGSDDLLDEPPETASRWEQAEQIAEAADAHRRLGGLERKLARARSVARVRRAALWVAALTFLAGSAWAAWNWQTPARSVGPAIFCGALIALCVGGAVADARWRSPGQSQADLEDELEIKRGATHIVSSFFHPSLDQQRSLYREEVADVITQHRADSRKYRLVHNTLQNFIMIGSAATTTVAALDTGGKLTWQNVLIVAIGFAVTLSAAFTGYYKYRERSYFLLQTADAIEEEANAFALGIGPYGEYDQDQRSQALKVFTQRVEDHRNEQRRRQQQLDQPADQAGPSSQQPGA